MDIPAKLIEVGEYSGPGYRPLVDYRAWRVALMNYTPDLTPDRICRMQRHDETDEVFVLLAGRCILFLMEDRADASVHSVDMQLFRLYNVRRGAWHSHTFSPDARVLIVENADTSDANSPFLDLTPAQRAEIVSLTRAAWGG
jgi:hypothetical protein